MKALKFRGWTALLFPFLLAACDSGNLTIPKLDLETELNGSVLLGLVSNGVVTATDPADGSTLSETTTDTDGNYALDIPNSHSGPVLVEITPASDGSSMYLCDFAGGCPDPGNPGTTIAFGSTVRYTGTLSAAATDASGVNTLNINPFTTAVVARANELGGLTVPNIEQANQEMSAALSDLLDVDFPSDIAQIPNVNLVSPPSETDDPEIEAGVLLATLNAGLVALVKSDNTLDDVIQNLSAGFEDGEFETSSSFNAGSLGAGELLFATEQAVSTASTSQPSLLETLNTLAPNANVTQLQQTAKTKRNELAPIPPTISGAPPTSTLEDEQYSFTPSATDPDDTDLAFSVTNLPSWASFDTGTGTLSGTPGNDDVGTFSDIVISVSDGFSQTALAAFSIEVINVNDAPTIAGTPPTSVLEDDTFSFTPTASDVDPNPELTFSISNAPAWAQFDPTTGTLSGIPANGDVGTTQGIVISVSDGEATTSLAAFDLEVINTNDPPTIAGTPPTSVDEDSPYSFTPMAADVDPVSTLTFAATADGGLPLWLAFDTSSGTLSGTPLNDDVGVVTNVVVSVTDGQAQASLTPFDIQVLNTNDAPDLSNSGAPPTSVTEDETYSYQPTAVDVDVGDTLTFTATSAGGALPGWLSIDASTGLLSGVPQNSDAIVGSADNILITVTDAAGASDSLAPFSITIVNIPPAISGTPDPAFEDEPYVFAPNAVGGDDLNVTNLPPWAQFNDVTGAITGTPSNEDVGTYSNISISISDGVDTVSIDNLSIVVNNTNDPPTIAGTPATSVDEDSTYTFDASADDDDFFNNNDPNESLTFTITNKPSWATFDTVTGVLTGTPVNADVPNSPYSGIVVGVVDNSGALTELPAFSITVNNTNDAPVLSTNPAPATSVLEDQTYSFQAIADDDDYIADPNEVVTYSAAWDGGALPNWLTLDANTGVLTGTPRNADVGIITNVVITATDNVGASDSLAFDLEVVNVPPTLSGTPQDAVEDSAFSFTPMSGGGQDFSVSPQPTTWWSFNSNDGTISGTPTNDDVKPSEQITISLSDGNDTVDLPLDFAVINTNDVPTLTGTPPDFAVVDQLYSFSPVADDDDVGDLAGLIFTVSTNKPSWASLTTSGTNPVLSGTPPLDDDGTVYSDVSISADDGHGEPNSVGTITFTIQVVNATMINLQWDNPTEFADGSTLDPAVDLTGFEVCWVREGSVEPEECSTGTVGIGAPIPDTYTTPLLAFGSYTFTVSVFDTVGNESVRNAFAAFF